MDHGYTHDNDTIDTRTILLVGPGGDGDTAWSLYRDGEWCSSGGSRGQGEGRADHAHHRLDARRAPRHARPRPGRSPALQRRDRRTLRLVPGPRSRAPGRAGGLGLTGPQPALARDPDGARRRR